MIASAILHCDGGSRGNPGPGGIGFVIEVDNGAGLEILCDGGATIGIATNNQAEYLALIWGLQNAAALKIRSLDIRADSDLMVRQLNGEYRVKSAKIAPLFLRAEALLGSFAFYTLRHLPRAENTHADALVNQALDAGTSVGRYIVRFDDGQGSLALEFDEAPNAGASASSRVFQGEGSQATALPTPDASSQQLRAASPGTYTLTVKGHFDAAHSLAGYPGECRNLHGHTWDVEVSVSGSELDAVGLLYDFKDLKGLLSRVLDSYDHRYLNDVQPFDSFNSTAENLARVIYQRIQGELPKGIRLVEVVVWESPQARLTYRES